MIGDFVRDPLMVTEPMIPLNSSLTRKTQLLNSHKFRPHLS